MSLPLPTMSLSSTENGLMTAGMFILCAFAVFGNLLTIVASCCYSTIRTRTHILIANLAVSDILVSLLAAPLRILQSNGDNWSLKVDNCRIVISLTLFFCNASVLNLTLISIDRAVSLASPLTYNQSAKSIRLKIEIIASWMVAIFISLLPFIGFGWRRDSDRLYKKELEMCRYLSILDKNYVVFVFVTAVFAPFFVMMGCYAYILKIALSHVRKIAAVERSVQKSDAYKRVSQSNCTDTASTTRRNENKRPLNYRSFLFMKELKAAKMIAMVIGFFVLCVVPIVLVDIAEIICGHSCAPNAFVLFAVCLSYMNPAVNILAYATISSDYRKAYKKILQSIFCCKKRNS